MNTCANTTCDRKLPIAHSWGRPPKYCSRMCQARPNGYHLTQVKIPLWLYHAIERKCRDSGLTFDEVVRFAIANEVT